MAQSLGSFAADAPRFAIDLAAQNGAYYAKADAKGAQAVDSLQTLTGDVVLTSTNGSVTITTSGQNINLAASGSGGVTAVVGTANQIGVVTASGTATVALAAPSPAPTPGSYLSPSLTVDGLGRVTAIQGGSPSVPYFGTSNNNAQNFNRLTLFGNTNNEGVDGTATYYNMNYISATIGAFMNGVGFAPLLLNHIYRWSMNGKIEIANLGPGQAVGQWYLGLNTNQDAAPTSTPNGSITAPNSYIFAQSPYQTTIANGANLFSNFSASTLVVGKGKVPCLFFATDTALTPDTTGDPMVNGLTVTVSTFGPNISPYSGQAGGCLVIEDLGLGVALSGTPSAPVVSPTVTPVPTRIDVQWNITGLTASPAPNFQLLIGTSATGPFALPGSLGPFTSLGNGVFSAYVTGLTTGTTYYFTVSANNGIGPVITSPASAGIVCT